MRGQGLCPRSVPRGDLGPASQGQCPGEVACPAGFLPGPGAGAPRCLRCPEHGRRGCCSPSLHPAFPSPRAFARGFLPKLLGRDTCPPTGCRPTRDGCPSGWRCRGSGRGGRRTRRGREQRPEPDPARERQEAERSIRGGLRGAGCGEAGRMGQTLKERMKPNEAGSTLSPKGRKPLEHLLDGGGAQP